MTPELPQRDEGQRVDRWLWVARFFKTRTAAAQAVSGGKVRLDGQRVKPSKLVRPRDLLSIRRGDTLWEVTVLGTAATRRPAREAAALYEESEESRASRERAAKARREAAEARAIRGGRPSKRERRQLARLRGEDD